jgi:DAACS family dicarboxylate/amino acid:cation (Na+ or H+) symporter
MKLHTKIMLGLATGLVAGIVTNLVLGESSRHHGALEFVIANATDPIGQIFLRLLFLAVVPLVTASLALGVSNMGDLRTVGHLGARTLAFFVLLTVVAVLIGMFLVGIFEPGRNFDPVMQTQLMEWYGGGTHQVIEKSREIAFTVMTFVEMVLPRNILRAVVDMQMLPIIMVSLLFGGMMMKMPGTVRGSLERALTGLNAFAVSVVDLAMRLAPVAVACLVFGIGARFGFSVLKPLGLYVLLVFVGYTIHTVLVYSGFLTFVARFSPVRFFKTARPVMITAFSTSSSNATLPTTLKVTQDDLNVPASIAGFVIPLGATINMNGTALYEGMTVLFIAEIFGIELSLLQQAVIIVMTVLTAIGTAGVPGGSLPLIILVMQTVGVPAEGIGIILGVDRLLDMGRTVVNVTGDMVTAVCLSRPVARADAKNAGFSNRNA